MILLQSTKENKGVLLFYNELSCEKDHNIKSQTSEGKGKDIHQLDVFSNNINHEEAHIDAR